MGGEVGRREVRLHEAEQFRCKRRLHARRERMGRVAQDLAIRLELPPRLAEAHPPRRALHVLRTLEQLDVHVLPRRHLLLHLAAPAAEQVGPGLDGEDPAADRVEREGTAPSVDGEVVGERRVRPGVARGAAVADAGAEQVVPLLEDVGADHAQVTHGALDAKRPASSSGVTASIAMWGSGSPAWGCDGVLLSRVRCWVAGGEELRSCFKSQADATKQARAWAGRNAHCEEGGCQGSRPAPTSGARLPHVVAGT
jgi:hypothetical protein